ncbi:MULTISPECIES: sugar O-acetyltransferase [Pseudoalteromonas]|uniref:sugar O-acetyltransferase n=1 Tax=Pseudoalteromonas TaxID=53246 RepID=UPI0003032165|nr:MULTISPECIES: sugar O-acetyltransferase [Pseudoalteromonas]MCF6144557.1 maltose O-acetyltransferase [Pseudoalteromonas mariniglutinosa NCIMB 1770]
MTNTITEFEKMLAGLPYKASEPELVKARSLAKLACHQFNLADPTTPHVRIKILAELLKFKGKAYLEPMFYCDYGFNIELGDNFYANHNLTILDVCKVTIGNNVMFGPNVMISTATHPIDPIERRSTESGSPITIGNDVWLGGNVSVLPGVSIGDRCVIGAGSVVTKNIPANSVAVGNPCKVIRSIEAK